MYISSWYFTVYASCIPLSRRFKEGPSEKQGKHHWASRYLALVGSRLLVYRNSIRQLQGDENFPLNVIDLTNALLGTRSKAVITIQTHRLVGERPRAHV